MCLDPDLSETLIALQLALIPAVIHWPKKRAIDWLRAMRHGMGVVGGRRYIPRALKACWP